MKNRSGFTLIELLITMGLVIGVIFITTSAFNTILKQSANITSSEESNIEGVVGLEMFRHDLQQTGFGLPAAYNNPGIIYNEATSSPASLLNDDSASPAVPRAIVTIDAISGATDSTSETSNPHNILDGTDYLAIKATTVGRSKASQKWTYVSYSSNGGKKPNVWPNSVDNLKNGDRVIVVSRTFSKDGAVNNQMVFPAASPQTYWASNATTIMNSDFNPTDSNQINYIYGVDDGDLGMPFNRADYFVARPTITTQIPTVCAPGTGILYKANVNHNGGALTYMPILDCVADMQVVLGWEDPVGSGVITESAASGATTPTAVAAWMASPEEIKNRLKFVKVYVMVQDGRKDTNFENKNTLGPGSIYSVVVGEPGPSPASNVSITKAYSLADLNAKGWQNYKWKVYRIIVRPKNLTN